MTLSGSAIQILADGNWKGSATNGRRLERTQNKTGWYSGISEHASTRHISKTGEWSQIWQHSAMENHYALYSFGDRQPADTVGGMAV